MRDCKRIAFGVMERADSSDDFPLRVRVTLAKTGVLEYVRADGTVSREAKLPEDLFHADTIASLKGAPITMEHPEGLVSPANAKELVKGSIMDSVQEKDGTLVGNGVIYDADLITAGKAGKKKEVSMGFLHKLEEKSGEINGDSYDFIQREIKVNHVAATDSGRAGPEVAIHLDSKQDIAVQKNDSVTKELDNMKKVTIKLDADIIKKLADLSKMLKSKDNEHIEQATEKIAEVATELQAAVADEPAPDSLTDLAQANKRIIELEAQIDGLKSIVEGFKTEIAATTSPEAMDKRLESRAQILQVAKNVVKDFKADGKSEKDMMIEVVNSVIPKKDGKEVVTKDSKKEVLDAQYGAAVELARIKGLSGDHQRKRKDIKTDESELQTLKDNRLTMKEDADKERKGVK